jgi:perosamine synthetase
MEPMFQRMNMGGREVFFDAPFFTGVKQTYAPGLCPNAETLQPKLIQFKTSYTDAARFAKQLEALKKTIAQFS